MTDYEKPCPVCAETIKAAALKCRFCNSDLRALDEEHEAEVERTIFAGNPAVIYSSWQVVAVFCTFGLAYLFLKAKSLSVRYEITTQRIKIERGYMFKVKDYIELFTVDHFEIESSVGMRLAGYCVLRLVFTYDGRPGNLCIYGVEDLEALAETLRDCSFRERTRRKITSFIQP